MSIHDVEAIDVHGHYGLYRRKDCHVVDAWLTASADTVVQRSSLAGTRLTIVSPLAGLLPRAEADAFAANEDASRVVSTNDSLRQWVIVNPLQERTFPQAAQMLQQPHCVGIKLHPEEHCYPIREHGAALFDFAAQHDAVVLAHSGDANSSPADFVPLADQHSNVRLILAHLGNGGGATGDPTLQVRALNASRHGNIFVDTSSSRSVLPGLIEWAVGEIGSERILYGTDTPLYFAPMQRARIDFADITDPDKHRILRENAERLFDL